MTVFTATLDRMVFLFLFIGVGFLLGKIKFLPSGSEKILSKLENAVFIPALVLGTFIDKCTPKTLSNMKWLLLFSFASLAVIIPLTLIVTRFITKDSYLRKIYTYGLCFANFGFMGNAVMEALFPEMFFEYLVFTLPWWALIYLWGVPALLLDNSDEGKEASGTKKMLSRIKAFLNPMFIAMIIGAVIGLCGIGNYIPKGVTSAIKSAGDCMSPVAMILTGLTVANIDIKKVFKTPSIYAVTFLRLVVYPLLAVLIFTFVDIPKTYYICLLCGLAMPLGLNTIVVPGAYGKDTSVAAGMAVVSHVLSAITVPVIFLLFLS